MNGGIIDDRCPVSGDRTLWAVVVDVGRARVSFPYRFYRIVVPIRVGNPGVSLKEKQRLVLHFASRARYAVFWIILAIRRSEYDEMASFNGCANHLVASCGVWSADQ